MLFRTDVVLPGDAGGLLLCKPQGGRDWAWKGWNVAMSLNHAWAKRAHELDFREVSKAFRKMGYEEKFSLVGPGFREFGRGDIEPIYVFSPRDGGLVRGINDLAIDGSNFRENLGRGFSIDYQTVNLDSRSSQDWHKEKCLEYVSAINSILK